MTFQARYVILDFDGVIADTENVFASFDRDLMNAYLERGGVEARVEYDEMRALAGNPGEDKFDIIAGRYGVDLSAHRDAFIEERSEARSVLFRDVPAPLGRNLKELLALMTGRFALATNKTSAKLFHDMGLIGLTDLFPVIVPCDPPFRKKPEPDILLEAAKRIGAKPEQCVYVGDNTLDMVAAKAAGMAAAGFVIEGLSGHDERVRALVDAGADIVIDDFMSLERHLETV
ncbi:HAD family hydrolase [Alphaproteobacteria bacterium]|nr:HAD family hydrolase [Alphaproteobacteria bacterium]